VSRRGLPIVVSVVGAAGLIAGACGGGLVTPSAFDEPLFTFSAQILPPGQLATATHPIISVLWIDPEQQRPSVPMPARSMTSSVPEPALSGGTYDVGTFWVYRQPPEEVMFDLPIGNASPPLTARMAVGELVIVDDADGDGTFRVAGAGPDIAESAAGQPQDRYLGGALAFLSYSQSSPLETPFTEMSQHGYELVEVDCRGVFVTARRFYLSSAADSNLATMIARAPSTAFPQVRTCLQSQPP